MENRGKMVYAGKLVSPALLTHLLPVHYWRYQLEINYMNQSNISQKSDIVQDSKCFLYDW